MMNPAALPYILSEVTSCLSSNITASHPSHLYLWYSQCCTIDPPQPAVPWISERDGGAAVAELPLRDDYR